MLLEVLDEHVDDLWVGVPSFDEALVGPTLEVLLGLFVDEGPTEDGPESALCGEVYGLRDGDAEGGCGVAGEVYEEIKELGVVGAEVQGGDGDAVSLGEVVWGADATTVDDAGGVFGLGQCLWR